MRSLVVILALALITAVASIKYIDHGIDQHRDAITGNPAYTMVIPASTVNTGSNSLYVPYTIKLDIDSSTSTLDGGYIDYQTVMGYRLYQPVVNAQYHVFNEDWSGGDIKVTNE